MLLRILCIGNMLHGNDGLGPAVYRQLHSIDEPGKVEVVDAGVGGLTLLPLFNDVLHVLLIDIVNNDRPPGYCELQRNVMQALSWRVNEPAEHGGGVYSLLQCLPLYLSHVPQIDLLSVTAPSPEYYRPGLSPAISEVVSEVCAQAIAYVAALYARENEALRVRQSDAC